MNILSTGERSFGFSRFYYYVFITHLFNWVFLESLSKKYVSWQTAWRFSEWIVNKTDTDTTEKPPNVQVFIDNLYLPRVTSFIEFFWQWNDTVCHCKKLDCVSPSQVLTVPCHFKYRQPPITMNGGQSHPEPTFSNKPLTLIYTLPLPSFHMAPHYRQWTLITDSAASAGNASPSSSQWRCHNCSRRSTVADVRK